MKNYHDYDLKLSGMYDFDTTDFTVEPVTEKGKEFFKDSFLPGSLSVQIPNTDLAKFMKFAEDRGVSV